VQYATQQFEIGMISCQAVIRFSVFCEFLKARASGEVPTCAKYLRSLMTSHLHYNRDSVVTPSMAARAMTAAALVGAGIFKNDTASVKPHLGRFVLDAYSVYSGECGHSCCVLKDLRKEIHKYEGLNGGFTPFSALRENLLGSSRGDGSLKCVTTEDYTSDKKKVVIESGADTGIVDPAATTSDKDVFGFENIIANPARNATLSVDSIESNNGSVASSGEFNSRMQNMIECREKGDELDCTIHGIHKGLFSPIGYNGGYKEPFCYIDEWKETHDVTPLEPSGIHCHDILKALLENGADLSKLALEGFPCKQKRCDGIRSLPSTLYMTVANDAEFDGGLGPFVPTLEAKSKIWLNYQQQLENEELLPEWQARKRMAK